LAVSADGTVLVTTEYGRALNAASVDGAGNLTTAKKAVAFGTPTIVPHSTNGYVPTGWYPTAVAVNPLDHGVLAVSAKGLGSRYPARDPSYPYPVPFATLFGSPSLLPNSTFPQTPHPEVQLQGLNYNDKGNMPSLLSRFWVAGPHQGENGDSHGTERLSTDSAFVA
jgi:hypothetical protein